LQGAIALLRRCEQGGAMRFRLLRPTRCHCLDRHSGAPRSGEPGIQHFAALLFLDSGFALKRAPE
jgi:hypothetical protein